MIKVSRSWLVSGLLIAATAAYWVSSDERSADTGSNDQNSADLTDADTTAVSELEPAQELVAPSDSQHTPFSVKSSEAVAAGSTPSEEAAPLPADREPPELIANDILTSLSAVAELSDLDHVQWAELQEQLLDVVSADAQVISELLSRYPKLSSGTEKSLLRELLRSTDRQLIEDTAIAQLAQGNSNQTGDWIELVASVGISDSDNQQMMLDQLKTMHRPQDMQNAIRSLLPHSPNGLSANEVVDQLKQYTNHPDERIRISSIQEIGEWVGPDETYYIEQALADPSVSIQEAAILSLSASGIRSDLIKNSLLETMKNENTDWNLRMSAFRALNDLPLYGLELDAFNQFQNLSSNPPVIGGEG